ncbi:hypothetical protein vBKpPFBKp16_016 [Klebsiella phage vB_KpP_FBKp16]|uniref:Uncharacterized protein n=1 Tax=Klebsiella phage vB_KpP_FBKp16 TaxID=2801836 RepID=A0A7U0GAP0_9CAUD|nr:hypothetical protein vBKpPFBKp16_016 [Klebsiella phage vB_KpP_FBKp16]
MKGYIVKLRNGKLRYHLITPYGGTIAESMEDTKLMLGFGVKWLKGVSFQDYSSKRKIAAWYSKGERGRIVGVFHV